MTNRLIKKITNEVELLMLLKRAQKLEIDGGQIFITLPKGKYLEMYPCIDKNNPHFCRIAIDYREVVE